MTTSSLKEVLPSLLPATIDWAETQSAEILRSGEKLSASERQLALRVGVKDPDRIRLALVDQVPFPADPQLAEAALALGLISQGTLGMALGYGIFIRRGHRDSRLISHECRHVHQYEAAGTIAAFLREYLEQLATHGYRDAPLERDARLHEIT